MLYMLGYFIAFVIFLLVQVCIWNVSNYIAGLTGLTDWLYWSVVVVAFLILNEWCFGGFSGEAEFSTDSDDKESEWEEL